MRRLVIVLLNLFLFTGLYAQNNLNIAVIDFDAPDIGSSAVTALSNTVRLELVRLNKYTVVDRNNMQQILTEQGFQQSGACSDVSCLIQIGQLLGVQKMIGGTIGMLGQKFIVDLQIVDVQTGRIEKLEREEYTGALENLDTAIIRVTRRLTGEHVEPQNVTMLQIISNPSEAEVYVDEHFLGKTPVTMQVDDIKPHQIRLYKQGYLAWEKNVNIKAYELNTVKADLATMDQLRPVTPAKNIQKMRFSLGAMYGAGDCYGGQSGEDAHFTFVGSVGVPKFNFSMSYTTAQKFSGGTQFLKTESLMSYLGLDWNYYFADWKHYGSGLGIGIGKYFGTQESYISDFFTTGWDLSNSEPEDIALTSLYLNVLARITFSANFALSIMYRSHYNSEDFSDNWGTFDGGIVVTF
ncbi:PEGA domain-containing protein [candidate division KSB1 bacterium]|nr:PEGA domain-containing protein [candidate division KSB1 bacterium]